MNAILIPAYKPDDKLVALTDQLLTHDDLKLVVVDDGSGEAFRPVFEALDKRVTLISYPDNKGKGGALKTGIRYIMDHMPECERLVTADADGPAPLRGHPQGTRQVRGNARRAGAGKPRVRRRRAAAQPLRQRHDPTGVRHRQRREGARHATACVASTATACACSWTCPATATNTKSTCC